MDQKYVVAYYSVFAMRNESTVVNNKNILMLYYCFTLQCMIKKSIWFDGTTWCNVYWC